MHTSFNTSSTLFSNANKYYGLKNNTQGRLPYGNFQNNDNQDDSVSKSRQEIRSLIQGLNSTNNNTNPFWASPIGKENGYLNLSETGKSKKEEDIYNKYSGYKYKDISTKIQRAKTSVSAGQALIAAKRSVQEIKRKLYSGKGDTEELQISLSHAKRMEMVARKKKHNLELEEMVARTQWADAKAEELEESRESKESLAVKNMPIDQAEEEITAKEDEIFDTRSQMLDEAMEEVDAMTENGQEISDEMIAQLNETIAEFGEEELEMLEESMEMLENMEVVNPHMSEEDLKELITKHRNSERKAIVKADMDYLKDMIKHVMNNPKNPAISSNYYVFTGMTGASLVGSVAENPSPTFNLSI